MPKLSVMVTAVVAGLCFAQSDAYPQTDEDVPPDATYEREAPEAAIEAPLGLDVETPNEGVGAGGYMGPIEAEPPLGLDLETPNEGVGFGGYTGPADEIYEGDEMPPDEETEQQPDDTIE